MTERYTHTINWYAFRENYATDEDFATDHELNSDDLHEMFDEFLNETNQEVTVFGVSYQFSRVAKEVDPVAYNCEFNNWLDSQIGHSLVEF